MTSPYSRQLNLKVRVRPQRIAVLIRSTASKKRFRDVVASLSSIWGGQYAAIIPALRKDVERVRRRLTSVCPEIVVAVDLNDSFWEPTVREVCQPRVYVRMPNDWTPLVGPRSMLGLISCYAAMNQVAKAIATAESTKIRIPPAGQNPSYQLLYDVLFGIPDADSIPWLRRSLKAEEVAVGESRPFSIYSATCTALGERFTWLDLAAHRLGRQHYSGDGGVSPPTIILLERTVADLALYWSLRMGHGQGASRFLLPVPRREIQQPDSIDAIVTWIKNTNIDSNNCRVTSDAAPSPATEELAVVIKSRLRRSGYRFVDVVPESEIWPTIAPFEQRDDDVISATLSDNNLLTCEFPTPSLEEPFGKGDVWMVDVTSDLSTRRSLGEIAVPRTNTMSQVLQAATPPSIPTGIPSTGLALDGISFRCTQSDRRIRYQIPTAEEFLHTQLRECGMTLEADEKERRYRAVMDLCGGLRKTCNVFRGTPAAILEAVKNSTRPEGDIISRLRDSGGSHESRDAYMTRINRLVERMPRATSDVTRRRFDQYADDAIHSGDPVRLVLHKLVHRRILEPRLKLGRCPLCHDKSWLTGLNLTDRVMCPGCGAPRILKGRLEIGYSLNPLVAVALAEGIRTVVLTARFLLNSTSSGFLWLPGCKGKMSGDPFDFDIIASCDGRLVVAECKTLDSNQTSSDSWDGIAQQFERTIDAGVRSQAELAVFACQANGHNRAFERRIAGYAGSRIHLLFLNNADLDSAHREINDPRGGKRWATIEDFVRTGRRHKRRRRAPRTIQIGCGMGRISR